ncbi:hypothetical protein KY289_001634 [Solanum tuberosum]|nr:hypothetical protein KY289_001634 [Solanum tuberosum]
MHSARIIPKSSAMAFHHSKGRTNQSPDWWDFLKKPRKVIPNRVVAMTTSETNQPNNDGKIEPRVDMTQPGITSNNNVNVNLTALSTNNTWIINSGTSDNMNKHLSESQSLKPSSKPFISIANSGTSLVIGKGPIVLTDALRLDSVWDILTRGTLGYDVKRHNLYFLELPKGEEKKFSHAFGTYGLRKHRTMYGYGIEGSDISRLALNISDKSVFGNVTMPWNLCNLLLTNTFGNEQKIHSLCSLPHLPNLEPRVFGCTVYTHSPKALPGNWIRVQDEPYYKGGVTPLALHGENDIEETRMNRALWGETEFLELEAHEEREMPIPISWNKTLSHMKTMKESCKKEITIRKSKMKTMKELFQKVQQSLH